MIVNSIWDTIFRPKEFGGLPYAEVSEDAARGVPEKMKISQSYRALRRFLEMRAKKGASDFFS